MVSLAKTPNRHKASWEEVLPEAVWPGGSSSRQDPEPGGAEEQAEEEGRAETDWFAWGEVWDNRSQPSRESSPVKESETGWSKARMRRRQSKINNRRKNTVSLKLQCRTFVSPFWPSVINSNNSYLDVTPVLWLRVSPHPGDMTWLGLTEDSLPWLTVTIQSLLRWCKIHHYWGASMGMSSHTLD